jgi:hypothetical protein
MHTTSVIELRNWARLLWRLPAGALEYALHKENSRLSCHV